MEGLFLSRHPDTSKRSTVISTFLVDHAALVPIAFWIAVAVVTAIAWLLHRRGAERSLLVLAALAFVVGIALTVYPPDGTPRVFCAVQFSVPFDGIDTLANIALPLPGALLLAVAVGRPLLVAAAVSGLSALIELVQAGVPAIGRSCDTNDWFMNTIGALLAAFLAALILRGEKRRGRRRMVR
ncbi:VanZ family protein [Rathayibacter sp. AY1E9]|uniref:VanZ family protein n=1 Tax=unclassified Rathayibacter TaxID=2609250 RepID=UPI000CE7C751|nr:MULTISPECIES: VanZ family protein [unclassified Rathayibacter]PPG54244.1 VanZ family protein [Rathayibacter sp. AY1E9]PPG58237.1 VanZ family protein [Rathayibacter sp. AY1C5]PPH41051.1 VanZ family protein [Rathayibacter sp. AY1E4]